MLRRALRAQPRSTKTIGTFPRPYDSLEDAAHDTVDRGLADALIVSGIGTGQAADLDDVERVRTACPKTKLLLGSGVNADNVKNYLRFADGVIVGSSLKRDGKLANPVDARRVAALVKAMRKP